MALLSIKIVALYGPLFVSFIWGITLFFKNYKTKNPGYYISFVEFSAFCIFLSIVPFYHNEVVLSVRLEPIYFAGLLSIFPFVYIYVRFITTKQQINTATIIRHLIPAVLISSNSLLMQLALTPDELIIYALRTDYTFDQHSMLFYFAHAAWIIRFTLISQSIYYLYKSSKLISSYKDNVRAYFSNIKGKYFNWIHIFYVIFTISILAAIPPLIVGNAYLVNNGSHLLTASFFTLSIVFYAIGYMADNHSYIEDNEFYEHFMPSNNNVHNRVHADLAKNIEQYFADTKPYLDKDLKLSDLANSLATNRTYISDTLRNVFDTNFNHYVNVHRVDEAVAMFNDSEYDKLTTIEISERAGFHTYHSFVKSFKKKYRCTPASYRKKEALVLGR